MVARTMANPGVELLNVRTAGAKGGEAKWDEVKATRAIGALILIPLGLLHSREGGGRFAQSTSGLRDPDEVDTTMKIARQSIEDNFSKVGLPRTTAGRRRAVTLYVVDACLSSTLCDVGHTF